ncbi:MAG: hypothetical protein V9H69_25850 [Anaerolineae bacterium]|jgi:hypothetical protein
MTVRSSQAEAANCQELARLLEPLIRRVVREELAQVAVKRPDVFYLKPDSPLREDMIEILDRHKKGTVKLYSHSEVWNE